MFPGSVFLLLCVVGAGHAIDSQVGVGLGAGWFTAPTVSSQAEGLRPSLVLVGEAWLDRGPFAVGMDLTSDFSHASSVYGSEIRQSETLVLNSGVLMMGTTIPVSEFPAKVRLALGAGGVHTWDRLDRGSQSFLQIGWGPEFHLASIWEREVGRHSLVRIRLAGIYSRTFPSPVEGIGIESASDWSRVEFSMGWSWKS